MISLSVIWGFLMTLHITDSNKIKVGALVREGFSLFLVSLLFAIASSMVFSRYIPQTEARSIAKFPVTEINLEDDYITYIDKSADTPQEDRLIAEGCTLKLTDEEDEYIEIYRSDFKYSWMKWLFLGGDMRYNKEIVINVSDATMHKLDRG